MESLKVIRTVLCIVLVLCFKLRHKGQATAAVTINPSEIAQVCAGDTLEFTCNITGTFLEWRYPLISSSSGQFQYGIEASDSAEAYKHHLVDSSTINITFSRISAKGSPVSSRLLISPVIESHNGTEVTCVDMSSSPAMESSTTIIVIENIESCQQTIAIFTMAEYSICNDPHGILTDENSTIVSYNETAVEGSIITFRCSHGMEVKNAVCTANGEWEPKLSCISTMITTNSQEIISISVVLGSTFGTITVFSAVTAVVVIVLILSIKRNKLRMKDTMGCSVRDEVELYSTNDSSKVGVDGTIVYADIGPSSFNRQSHQHHNIIPALDADPVKYAQIKHNNKHMETSSIAEKVQPSLRADIREVRSDESPKLNLDNLLIQLRPQVTPKWYQFGVAAGIQTDVLDSFAKQCSPEDCIMEMLDCWLRKHIRQPTWTDVANILKHINLPLLASEIERIEITGELPVHVDMDWVPQPLVENTESDSNSITTESSPPIPPKTCLIEVHPVPSAIDHSAPALPPKPANWCGSTTEII